MNDYPLFDSARVVEKHVLESDLQHAAVTWARARGWWARKLSSPQNNGIMDYMFAKDTWVELVEFKKPGNCKKPARGLSPTQIEEHKLARKAGNLPVVHDNLDQFKDFMLAAEEKLKLGGFCCSREIRLTYSAAFMPNLK